MSTRYNAKKPSLINKQVKKTKTPKPVERLQPLSSNVKLDNEHDSKSIIDAIKRIHSIQWNLIPHQLNPDFQQHIKNYRNFLPKIVSRYQIYSLIPNNQTFIDQSLDSLVEDGILKKFILQENDDLNDLLMGRSDYDTMIDTILSKDTDSLTKSSINGLRKFIEQNLKLVKFSKDIISPSFTNDDEFHKLVSLNLLEILPQSSAKSQVKLSVPKYGYVINLYQKSKKFVLRTISRNQWKEIKHNDLYEKWESNKLKFKDFKGLNLYWILHWLIGEGILEIFKISDGNGYKIIRQ